MSEIFCSTCTNFLYLPAVTMATITATSEAMKVTGQLSP